MLATAVMSVCEPAGPFSVLTAFQIGVCSTTLIFSLAVNSNLLTVTLSTKHEHNLSFGIFLLHISATTAPQQKDVF